MEDKDIEILGNTEQFNFTGSVDETLSQETNNDLGTNIETPPVQELSDANVQNEIVPDGNTSAAFNNVVEAPDSFMPENYTSIPDNSPGTVNIQSVSDNKSVLNKHNSYFNRITKYVSSCIISIIVFILLLTFYNLISNQTITYSENSNSDYNVCLKENNYYQDKCLGPNVEYVSAITDFIRADFNYTAVYQAKAKKEFKYYIQSKLVIKTDEENERELLKKEKKLSKSKKAILNGNVLTIAETVDIPFTEFNSYAQSYKNDYSLLSNCNLIVSLVLKDGKNEKDVTSLTIPLTKLTYNISTKELKDQVGIYKENSNGILKYLLLILMAGSIGFAGLSFKNLFGFLWKTRSKSSEYQKQLKHILNTYDRVIVTLQDKNTIVNDQEVYKVQSFLELLDVRDTVDKPILYYKVNDIKAEFYVQDVNKTYKYTMKESDFDSK